MIDIRLGINDYGSPYRLFYYPEDGKYFSSAELATASYLFRIYRKDYLRLSCGSSDDRIYTSDTSKMRYYNDGDMLIIGNESMEITGQPSFEGKYIKVTRPTPMFHPKQSVISHVIFESATVVTYDQQGRSIVMIPELGMVEVPGTYLFLIQIDTGTRKSTVKKHSANNPYVITFLPEL